MIIGSNEPLISIVKYDKYNVPYQYISIDHNGQVIFNTQIFPPHENIAKIANMYIKTYNIYELKDDYDLSSKEYFIITVNTNDFYKKIKTNNATYTINNFVGAIESLAKTGNKL